MGLVADKCFATEATEAAEVKVEFTGERSNKVPGSDTFECSSVVGGP